MNERTAASRVRARAASAVTCLRLPVRGRTQTGRGFGRQVAACLPVRQANLKELGYGG